MASTLSMKCVTDLIKSCLLPELLEDLDSVPIEREHFVAYHEHLQTQLPTLYDWVQLQGKWLFCANVENSEKITLKVYLIVLLCELCTFDGIYKLDNKKLLSNAQRILNSFETLPKEVTDDVFKYYEEKLHKDFWKRHIGSLHGFLVYLKHRYKESCSMEKQVLLFCLSIGLNVRLCHEIHYKTISMEIFQIALDLANPNDIHVLNVHAVIYEAVSKDIHILDTVTFVETMLNTLLKCLNFYTDMDSFTWSYADDILDIIIRNITLASDSTVSVCLLEFVNKLLVYFNINRQEFEDMLKRDLMDSETLEEVRTISKRNTSHNNYRWAKSILQMFVLESHKLLQTPGKSMRMLTELHRCYMVCILPIQLPILEPHLVTFFDKFPLLLMEAAKTHKKEDSLVKSITYMLETFYLQLRDCAKPSNLLQYKKAFYALLQHAPFKDNTTLSNVDAAPLTK